MATTTSAEFSGVYVITCLPTGKQYVGSAAKTIAGRWRQHRHRLRRGDHHSSRMQAAWNKYGEEAFSFSILLRCSPAEVLSHEQRLIDTMRPVFNTAKIAGNSRGFRFSDDQLFALRSRPQSTAKLYDYRGERLPVPEIARRMGVTPAAIYTRLRAGGGIEPRVTEQWDAPIDINGQMFTPRQIAAEFDLPLTTVYSRLRRGWTGATLIEPRRHRARNSRD